MRVSFYKAFFCLNEEEQEVFDGLTEEDDTLNQTVANCADMWRNQLRGSYPDPVLCRQMFLVRAVLISAKRGVKDGYGTMVAAAFALYLCDRVERLVLELDRKEKYAL